MNNFDTTRLEEAIRNLLLTGGVSTSVWTNRPKTVDSSKEDFVVVSVSGGTDDELAYGNSSVYVSLFAKDGSGFKNGKKLSVMYQRLRACMPASLNVTEGQEVVSSYEIDTTPVIYPDAADDYGYHCRIIQFDITIKVL